MHVLADYDGGTAVLTVTVTDEGAWRIADPETRSISRGRGIPLMHALADRATIDSTPAGTRVRLRMGSRRRDADRCRRQTSAQGCGSRTT